MMGPSVDSAMGPTEEAPLSEGELQAVAAMLAVIGVAGIVNNSTTLFLVGRYSQLRTPFNMLVVNLTVSDLLVCVLGTPFSFVSSLYGRWVFGDAGCVWYGFVNNLLGIVSLITLTVISYERHQMMKRPPNAPKLSYRWVALAVIFVWVYSLLWTVPPLAGWSSYSLEGPGVSCSVNWASHTAINTSYIVAFFVGCLAVPVAIIAISYTGVVLHVRRSQQLPLAIQQLPGAPQTGAKQQFPVIRRREKKVAKMVIVMVACFLLCWLPYGIVALIVTFGGEDIITPRVAIVPALFAKSSVAYNAAIYVAMNSQFRKCFMSYFNCKPRQEDPSSHQYVFKVNHVGISPCSSSLDRTADRPHVWEATTCNPFIDRTGKTTDNMGGRRTRAYSFPLGTVCPISEMGE